MHKLFSGEAEAGVLGGILVDNKAIDQVIDLLTCKDFYYDSHKLIYKAMVKLYKQGKTIDFVTLYEKIGESIKSAGGVSYLAKLSESAIAGQSISCYGEIVKEKSNNRILLNALEKSSKEIQNNNKNSDEIIDSMEDIFLKARTSSSEENGDTASTLIEVVNSLEERYKNGGEIPGIKTGYKAIDKMLGGFNKQDFIILAARPSMGKTAMAMNLALNTSIKENTSTAFLNLEMGKKQILERALSYTTGVYCSNIKNGSLKDKDWVNIIEASNKISKSPFYLYDKIFTLRGIRNQCRKLKIQKGLDIVIIDYLQLIQSEDKGENRNVDVSNISRSLKLMAKELDITVIALSQLSRAPEARMNHRPMLSDLRESGSLEQDADVVMFLYRDGYYNRDTKDKNIIETIVAKNRNGRVGTTKLKWMAECQRIEDR